MCKEEGVGIFKKWMTCAFYVPLMTCFGVFFFHPWFQFTTCQITIKNIFVFSQAIKQMYVLVLGLDVLGNPFGLIRGLGEGLEDLFYEPYQVNYIC